MNVAVQLIGLDWGTSSLRAYLYDVDGNVVSTRQHAWGIRQLPEGSFSAALRAITTGWPPCIILAAGMVGSRQGWQEVPYVEVPADINVIAKGVMRNNACARHDMWIAPGLLQDSPANVMRGEETQIIGALSQQSEHRANVRFVLPGTHSKWVTVSDGRIAAFDTIMTGEIYALLMKHSILGAGMSVEDPQPVPNDAFLRGLHSARESGAAGAFSRLFSSRALMLNNQLDADDVPEFLSGLLIGEEFRIALVRDGGDSSVPLCLIGDLSLCNRYAVAATYFGYASPAIIGDAAAQGLWQLASAAGLHSHAKTYDFFGIDA
ncbi:2-dehydro-3-deoxygalactonokinase [Dyella dinghuensis]|uniref:2-dehydro-3-deoxygalactonokinase n=1 Tax=Dyella dinghuensis TaxID=1920169 RepID=A0A432LU43_9GAMM|nr:2-dehydro-3-deoxygalactonokinase [Dyella dinghuensis]RUL64525.1 2-dehydro-3-deoxygalactonokinase [Dyella dinghuensis]